MLTSINLTDLKTFLISEIPGLYASSPKILIAGEGSDFTNLPIESPPPPDFGEWDESEEDIEKQRSETLPLSDDYKAYIYHSHTRESFLPLLPGVTNPDHASHKEKNITLLGKRLGEKLEEKGIKTIVDTTDVQSILAQRNMKYYQSYDVARELVVDAMNQNNQVELIFDLHRDSQRKEVTTTTINDQQYAKTYFVIGTGHSNYEKILHLRKSFIIN
ncbi:stage II sporulation protein P [Bacillus sp. N9]